MNAGPAGADGNTTFNAILIVLLVLSFLASSGTMYLWYSPRWRKVVHGANGKAKNPKKPEEQPGTPDHNPDKGRRTQGPTASERAKSVREDQQPVNFGTGAESVGRGGSRTTSSLAPFDAQDTHMPPPPPTGGMAILTSAQARAPSPSIGPKSPTPPPAQDEMAYLTPRPTSRPPQPTNSPPPPAVSLPSAFNSSPGTLSPTAQELPFHEKLLPETWLEFSTAEQGIYKGSQEHLEQYIRAHTGNALDRIMVHPNCLDLALVVVWKPNRQREVHGIPLSDSFRNVMKFFDSDSRNKAGSFERIQRLCSTALFDPRTLGDAGGPKLVEKGRVGF
jgi:hypothetical protein